MKPYPFVGLNHLTMPLCTVFPFSYVETRCRRFADHAHERSPAMRSRSVRITPADRDRSQSIRSVAPLHHRPLMISGNLARAAHPRPATKPRHNADVGGERRGSPLDCPADRDRCRTKTERPGAPPTPSPTPILAPRDYAAAGSNF